MRCIALRPAVCAVEGGGSSVSAGVAVAEREGEARARERCEDGEDGLEKRLDYVWCAVAGAGAGGGAARATSSAWSEEGRE